MKYFIAIYCFFILSASASLAQIPSAPVPALVVAPAATAPIPVVVKDESMAPPVFIQDIVVQAKALPVVGPYVVKIGQGLLILLSLLTALTACLASVLSVLKTVSNKAGLCGLYDKVVAFQNGKVFYYLKYASLAFNAQKPVSSDELPKDATT